MAVEPSNGNSWDTTTKTSHDSERTLQTPEGPTNSEQAPINEKYNPTGIRKVILNFNPSCFTVTMGTGIVSILLFDLPYNARWIYWLSIVFFALNTFLFLVFTLITVLRYILYPEVWGLMIRHRSQSLFLGAFPIGLATIINMMCFVCVPAWGPWTLKIVWGLWWIDVVLSLAICCYLPFVIMSLHHNELHTMTAVWLIPIVSTIVCAASGSVVASILIATSPSHALWTTLVSYILWGSGLPFALGILVIYFHRLTIHSLPPREVIVSVFLPLGPLGQGGFGIANLGKVTLALFPITHTLPAAGDAGLMAGQILYVLGFISALVLWGFGLVWLFFAVATINNAKRFPFNMGWWGFTFPLGVYASSTVQMGKELPSRFFDVLGTFLSICVVLLWCVVAAGTIRDSLGGKLFVAPCMSHLREALKKGKLLEKQDEKSISKAKETSHNSDLEVGKEPVASQA